MVARYRNIRRTPGFIADYKLIRSHLQDHCPVAYRALPQALTTILEVMTNHPQGWPIKRKNLAGKEVIFHLAVTDIAYRRLHVRYYVDENAICHLLTTWIDGQDEPRYM